MCFSLKKTKYYLKNNVKIKKTIKKSHFIYNLAFLI